jgi:hypothetical protein
MQPYFVPSHTNKEGGIGLMTYNQPKSIGCDTIVNLPCEDSCHEGRNMKEL